MRASLCLLFFPVLVASAQVPHTQSLFTPIPHSRVRSSSCSHSSLLTYLCSQPFSVHAGPKAPSRSHCLPLFTPCSHRRRHSKSWPNASPCRRCWFTAPMARTERASWWRFCCADIEQASSSSSLLPHPFGHMGPTWQLSAEGSALLAPPASLFRVFKPAALLQLKAE